MCVMAFLPWRDIGENCKQYCVQKQSRETNFRTIEKSAFALLPKRFSILHSLVTVFSNHFRGEAAIVSDSFATEKKPSGTQGTVALSFTYMFLTDNHMNASWVAVFNAASEMSRILNSGCQERI